mgnify:CR=1 FL=1
MTMVFKDIRVTFQALDPYNWSGLEMVLDRCTKGKPDLVMLPLNGGLTPLMLETKEEVD